MGGDGIFVGEKFFESDRFVAAWACAAVADSGHENAAVFAALGAEETGVAVGALFKWMGRGRLLGLPAPIVIAFIVFAVAWGFLSWTSYGRLVRAMGDNPSAARLSGAPVRPLTVATFVIAALLAALAGLVLLGKNGNYSTAYGGSNDLLFNAITAAVIGGVSLTGGKGTIFGVFAGTALTAVIVNILTLKNVSVMSGTLIKGLVLVAALALDAWLHPRDEETAKSDDL